MQYHTIANTIQQNTGVGYYIMLMARTCLTHVSLLPSCSRLHAPLPINLPSWDTPWRTVDDILSTYLERRILKLVPRFVMRPIEWLQFIQNRIWFSLLGRTNHYLHMTWTTIKFMSSLPRPLAILEVPGNYYVWAVDLTIFLMFPCSWSH